MYLTTYATIFFAPPQVISSAAQESENMGRALRKYVRLGVAKDSAPDILLSVNPMYPVHIGRKCFPRFDATHFPMRKVILDLQGKNCWESIKKKYTRLVRIKYARILPK